MQLPQSGPQGSWAAHVCWGECRPTEWQLVFFEPAPGEPGTLSGRMRAPAFHTGHLRPVGPQKVTVACRTKGCDGVPEASADFRMTGALSKVAWAALPAAAAPGMPNLSGAVRDAVDPANPNGKVVCKGGSVTPNDPLGTPELQVSEDGGKTWWSIPLKEVKLGQHSGMAGCRAVALDPHQKNTFYLAGAGHMAAYGWDRDPAPLYTVDAGQTWKQVPAPEGYGQPEAFIGYTMTPEGVTAWFGNPGEEKEVPAEIRGAFTADGGKRWREVPLGCPANGPCAWEVPASLFLPGYRGLLWSPDQGRTARRLTWGRMAPASLPPQPSRVAPSAVAHFSIVW